jgi:hypothetical protein
LDEQAGSDQASILIDRTFGCWFKVISDAIVRVTAIGPVVPRAWAYSGNFSTCKRGGQRTDEHKVAHKRPLEIGPNQQWFHLAKITRSTPMIARRFLLTALAMHFIRQCDANSATP